MVVFKTIVFIKLVVSLTTVSVLHIFDQIKVSRVPMYQIDYQVQYVVTEKWSNYTRRHKCQI